MVQEFHAIQEDSTLCFAEKNLINEFKAFFPTLGAKGNFYVLQHLQKKILTPHESAIEFDWRDFECQGESEWEEKHLHMLLSDDLSYTLLSNFYQQMQLEILGVIGKISPLSCHLKSQRAAAAALILKERNVCTMTAILCKKVLSVPNDQKCYSFIFHFG